MAAQPTRLSVQKTYKLYIDGKFPRSESGRTLEALDAAGELRAHVARGSRKDLRDAVEAARKALASWSGSTAYLRGQILYRLAEMLEGKRDEFVAILEGERTASRKQPSGASRPLDPVDEVRLSVDRLVAYAGWADKYAQVLGSNNPVAGPYYNFTAPEPSGVVACVSPDTPSLLGLINLIAPAVCAGNTTVVLASSRWPLAAAVFAECAATGDVPGGVLNILTGDRAELLPVIAEHRDIDVVHAANLSDAEATALRAGASENLKRVSIRVVPDWRDTHTCQGVDWIEPLIDFKTMWHPASA